MYDISPRILSPSSSFDDPLNALATFPMIKAMEGMIPPASIAAMVPMMSRI